MNDSGKDVSSRPVFIRPMLYVVGLAGLFIGLFLIISNHYYDSLFMGVEREYRQGLVNIVSVARNAIEPVLTRVRSGELDRREAIGRIRSLVRAMTYEDRDGQNYVFMSSYDGTMLVQPFEPEKELTNQWDLRDADGVYILQALVGAAKSQPEGAFVSYRYLLPGVHELQEKMAYVVGVPELECLIGTGMYMARVIQEQKELAERNNHIAILMLLSVLIPISFSFMIIYSRNRRLAKEIVFRKRAEDAAKSSRKLLSDILRAASEFSIVATDTRGTITVFNRGAERMLGYSSREVVGKMNVLSLHLPSEVSERGNMLTSELGRPETGFRVFAAKPDLVGTETREWTFVRKDGTRLPVSLVLTVVRSEDGDITGYLGIARDLTRKKETERALLENEVRLDSITRNLPGGVYQFCAWNDGTWQITYASQAMKEIFELPVGPDFNFDIFISHVHREDRPGFVASIEKVVKTCTTWDFKGRFIKPSGGEIWFHGLSTPIRREEAVVCDGIILDITDQKRLEQERQKLEQQLSLSQKMDAIGKLAGGVAHDFNNLLMGIQGKAATMMMDYGPEHPHYEKLRQIELHVERGAALTRQLLGFAREGKYEPRVVAINDLLRESVQFFIETRKEIEADLALAEDAGPVEADVGQMEQVFLNICINAGHAMPQGGRLRIETANVTLSAHGAALFQVAPGDYVKISISDTGAGMDPELLEKIFDPFFTTRPDQGGTGLGLASAYGIIRNHGGAINADSRPGHGATFTIHLPVSDKQASAPEKPAADGTLLEGKGGILVVDDEPVILEVASDILARLGYTVYLAENEKEAVRLFRERKDIDLVILDMILRGTSGTEVLNELKAVSPEVRVLLSSGYGLQGEVKKAMDMGCAGFIQKPYNFSELSKAVHRALASGSNAP